MIKRIRPARRFTAQAYLAVVITGSCLLNLSLAQEPQRLEFTRMIAHWANYADPGYLDFVADAEPELVQLGFYGGHFWSLAHTPQFGGYPAHFPVQGLDACGDWFAEKNAALKKRGVLVIGHFNVEFLVGDPDGPEGPRGFFKFYRDLWDETELGPRPVADPLELLEKDAAGKPIVQSAYGIGGMKEYWACLRNPHWQQVLKAWVKRGVARGVDGFIANYFYRHDCHCEHCQAEFRDYLAGRFSREQLRQQFSIEDPRTHEFDEIVYWHDPAKSTPLRREMLRWSQISNKRVFDKVFIEYGRSLKPGLIAAQWNHLGNFSQISGDERCLLPAETWGRGEDYLWYSAGGSAHYTDLEQGFLGDVTLQARFIRGAFDDKPFTIGKYEGTRIRSAIAELAANGGAPMGFYTRFTDPEARGVIVRYYQFLKQYDGLYRDNRPHAEVLLLFPRRSVHEGNVAAVERFRQQGKALLDAHVLFDVLPDDMADESAKARYAEIRTADDDDAALDKQDARFSRFDAPATVRVSATRPPSGGEITLHLVNYNREEPPRGRDGKPSAGRGIADEKPIAVERVGVDFLLPDGARVEAVEFITPETPQPRKVEFQQAASRVRFATPEFLVYSVVRLKLERREE